MYNLTNAAVGGNLALGNAGLTGLTGAVATLSTSALAYLINGAFYAGSAQSGVAVPGYNAASAGAVSGNAASGLAVQPLVAQQALPGYETTLVQPGSASAFVLGFDKSGLLRIAQGKVVPYSVGASCPLPFLPDWFAPIAYFTVSLASATPTSWTIGTGLWNATGVTVSNISNIALLPSTDPVAP
jgi:hypothetical protein